MKVCRAGQGTPYEASAHYGNWGAHYFKADETSRLTVSISHLLPNGGAEMGAGPERAYYMLSGSITVTGSSETHVLYAGDVLHIAAGEERAISVNGQEPASLLVVIVATDSPS